MRKFTSLLLSAILLFMCFAAAIPASAIGQQTVIKYGAPAIDGNIEKIWYNATRMRLMNVTGGDDYNGRLPGFSAAYVSVMWDEEAIYFLFEIFDDDFTFGSTGKYKNDCINIFIDEKDLYGRTWEDGQRQIRLVPSGDNPIQTVHGKEPKYSQIGYKFENDSCIIEYKYVPSDFKIENGARLLIDFSFEDIDENGELSYLFTWSDEIGEIDADSSNWSYLCFGTSGSTSHSGAKEAAAALGVTPISDYEFVKGSKGNPNESADKLWDGDVGTKFCTGEFPVYSTVKCSQKYYVTGLLMATANDTKEYTGRNPNDWKIEGSNDGVKWTEIISGDDSFFDDLNYTYFSTSVDCDEAYSYFKFSTKGADSGCFQLSEVTLCGTTVKDGVNANADREAVVQPIVPGGTIVEQISPEYNAEHTYAAEQITAGNDAKKDSAAGDLFVIIGMIAFLGAVVIVILYIQSEPKKRAK